jgi:hypothetical protein
MIVVSFVLKRKQEKFKARTSAGAQLHIEACPIVIA